MLTDILCSHLMQGCFLGCACDGHEPIKNPLKKTIPEACTHQVCSKWSRNSTHRH